MPFASKAQRRLFFAMEHRGEMSKAKVSEWSRATGDRALPERVRKHARGGMVEDATLPDEDGRRLLLEAIRRRRKLRR